MHRNFRLLFIAANSGYITHRKNVHISLKTCHDKTGHLKMLVESLYVCVLGIKYKSHNNEGLQYTRTVGTNSYFTILT